MILSVQMGLCHPKLANFTYEEINSINNLTDS